MRETEDQLRIIPQFCFPDAIDWEPVESYSRWAWNQRLSCSFQEQLIIQRQRFTANICCCPPSQRDVCLCFDRRRREQEIRILPPFTGKYNPIRECAATGQEVAEYHNDS